MVYFRVIWRFWRLRELLRTWFGEAKSDKKCRKIMTFSKFWNESRNGLGWFWECFGGVCELFGRSFSVWKCILPHFWCIGRAILVVLEVSDGLGAYLGGSQVAWECEKNLKLPLII